MKGLQLLRSRILNHTSLVVIDTLFAADGAVLAEEVMSALAPRIAEALVRPEEAAEFVEVLAGLCKIGDFFLL